MFTLIIRPINKPISDNNPIKPDDFIGECFETKEELKQKQDELTREWLINNNYKPFQKVIVYEIKTA